MTPKRHSYKDVTTEVGRPEAMAKKDSLEQLFIERDDIATDHASLIYEASVCSGMVNEDQRQLLINFSEDQFSLFTIYAKQAETLDEAITIKKRNEGPAPHGRPVAAKKR